MGALLAIPLALAEKEILPILVGEQRPLLVPSESSRRERDWELPWITAR
jgi:hypothetical protein